MYAATLEHLHCPSCTGALALSAAASKADDDIAWGEAGCSKCKQRYPILAGTLILVPDVRAYLVEHVKGIARHVPDDRIPKEHRPAFVKAKREIATEHIEEDLEAERVTALYLMTHYLRARDVVTDSPVITETIKRHWDHGPFAAIAAELAKRGGRRSLVELGCGVGGLLAALRPSVSDYLGLDSSFASVVLARRYALGAAARETEAAALPDDLLNGPASRRFVIKPPASAPKGADFVVCDLAQPPLKPAHWQACVALNVIDMLPEPAALPALQRELLTPGGLAIQSCPYIWHPEVAAELRASLPAEITDSADAVEALYEKSGFEIEKSERHVPWLFFKHARQLELYSVHIIYGALSEPRPNTRPARGGRGARASRS